MFNKIAKDNEVLAYYIKLAKQNIGSNKPTDILVELMKFAQSDILGRTDLSVLKVQEALQDQFKFDKFSPEVLQTLKEKIKHNDLSDANFQPYISIIKKNISNLFEAGIGLGEKSGIGLGGKGADKIEALTAFLTEESSKINIYRYVLNKLFTDGNVDLKSIINAGIKWHSGWELLKKQRGGYSGESLDPNEDNMLGIENAADLNSITADESLMNHEESIEELSPREKLESIENILKEKHSPYINVFINAYKEPLENIVNKIENETDINQKYEDMAMFDSAFEKVLNKVKQNYSDISRFSKTSINDLENELEKIKPTEQHINQIFNATNGAKNPLYSMPLMFRKYETEHPEFARLLLKTGLEAFMFKNLAKILGTTLAKAENRERTPGAQTRGRAVLSFGEIWESALNQAIDDTVTNPDLNKKFKELSRMSLKEGDKYKPGIRQVSDFFSPLSHAGHLMQEITDLGENFASLPEEEKNRIISNISQRTHPVYKQSVNPVLPHVTPKALNPRLFDVHDFEKLGKTPEEVQAILNAAINQRLNNAADIYSGRKSPGMLLSKREEDMPDATKKTNSSILNSLIEKYASKHKITV